MQISQENTCIGVFLNKFAGFQKCNFIKKETPTQVFSCELSELFKNNYFVEDLRTVGSETPAAFLRTPFFTEQLRWLILTFLHFQPTILLNKELRHRCFFCEFCKIFKIIFWQNTSGWLILVFICQFWEVVQIISFIEYLWKTAYFKYKLQDFNHQIQEKSISEVLFKHFTQEQEVAIRRRSPT